MKFKVTYGKTEGCLRVVLQVQEQVAVIQDQQIPKDEVLSLMETMLCGAVFFALFWAILVGRPTTIKTIPGFLMFFEGF